MKLFKSLLLGSAAGLVAVSGASAADLGVRKPTAAVEYVRVCSAHGAGFFYIPGSDVCMQISGRVRAEMAFGTTWGRSDDATSLRGHGRLNFDVRQTTEYGLLRAYVRMEAYADTGRYQGVAGGTGAGANALTTGGLLNKAFIQFYTGSAGFFTAGRSISFFDMYAIDGPNWNRTITSDRDNSNLFAYTFTFGGGLTATLALEDAYNRRVAGAGTIVYSGQRVPDVVGNVRIDQAWGSAQLSGALHQMHLMNMVGTRYVGQGWGWAIQAGVKLNLPMLAAGDALWLQAAYSQGAVDYAGVSRYAGDSQSFTQARSAVFSTDGYINGAGQLKKAMSWSVVGAFVHNFTPTIQGHLFAGFGVVDYPASTVSDYRAYQVGGGLSWLPVKGFRIGGEVSYNVLDPKAFVSVAGKPVKSKFDTVVARIRFQRDF